MQLIADGILIIAAAVAALYCMILSARLRRLMQTDGGLGETIRTMSTQVDEMNRALNEAKTSNVSSTESLRAETASALKASEDLKALIRRAEALQNSPVLSPVASKFEASQVEQPKSDETSQRKKAAHSDELGDAKALAEDFGEFSVAKKVGTKPKREIDGIISAYLKSHQGEDEGTIAKRLVTALADRKSLVSEAQK